MEDGDVSEKPVVAKPEGEAVAAVAAGGDDDEPGEWRAE